jgi:hypothetical protein
MSNIKEHNGITPESILASVEKMFAASSSRHDIEIAKSAAEFSRKLEQSQVDFDNKLEQSQAKSDAERAKSAADFDRRSVEFDRKLEQSQKKYDKISAELNKQLKDLSQQFGGMGNSHGKHAEDFFFNSLFYGQKKMFGEKFDDVTRSNSVTINKGYEDEYDIILLNGRAVCVVEVKYKADSGDLAEKILKKVQTFKVNFPHHKGKTIYLAVAAMSFNPLTEKACSESGIAIIKQVGETVAIYDKNLKTF